MIEPAATRIATVRTHPLRVRLDQAQRTSMGDWSSLEIVVVEITTESGETGFGECLARKGSPAYANFIDTVLAPLLIGENLLDRRRLWQRMRAVLTGRTGGMLIESIAGIDIALWDLAGRIAGLPVHRLLGGVGRSRIPAYASSINWSDDARAEAEIASAREAGFRSIKIKIGQPARAAIERARLARRLAGDEIELSVDANWAFDADDAMRVGRALAALDFAWFEEPIRPEDRAGYRRLRAQLPIRLAAGESDFCAQDALAMLEDRSIGLIQPDVARAGGITETWRIAELAAAFDVAYAPHVGWSGAICVAASLQLAAAAQRCAIIECMVFPNPLRESLTTRIVGDASQLVDGSLPIPGGAGLGIEVDRDFLAEHRAR
ncbi:MAG: mandelate racemase/muconate lactonizing enzyme family protein [Lautropia sp.]